MHRDQAKSRTRKAQLTVGALLLGAVAVVAVPASMLSPSEEGASGGSTVAGTSVALNKPVAKPSEPVVDAIDLATALDKIAPPPPVRPKVEPPKGVEGTVVSEVAAITAPPWRYIGVVLGQTRTGHRAIVTLNEQQQMLREGQQVDKDRVDEIHDSFLLVTNDKGEQRRVDMAVPARPQLIVAAPVPAAAQPATVVDELLAAGASEEDIAKAKQAIEDGFANYVPPSETNVKMRSPADIERMVNSMRDGNKFAPGTGVGPMESGANHNNGSMDAMRMLQRSRIQALDDAFHSGAINATEYKKKQKELSQEPSSKGTPEEQQRALDELLRQRVGGAGSSPR